MNEPKKALSRREFLAGAAAVPFVLGTAASRGMGQPKAVAENEKIGIGFIGFGRRGYELGNVLARLPQVKCVLACDVDTKRLDYAVKYIGRRQAGMKTCKDFRQVLDSKDVDAVFVLTPDHWHAIQVIEAARAGKDIFCESPLSLTVREARAMAEAVRRYGRVCQTGNYRRSMGSYREACELIQEGRLGEIKTVHVVAGDTSRFCSLPTQAVPANLDWNMWLGPAPDAPYHPYRCASSMSTSYGWRAWRDYSGGYLAFYGAHYFDVIQWALGMDKSGPVEVTPGDPPASSRRRRPEDPPAKPLTYRYANGVTVYNAKGPKEATIEFTGTDGVLAFGGKDPGRAGYRTWPEGIAAANDRRSRSRSSSRYYSSTSHLSEFLECIKTRSQPAADIETACRSVTVSHLGSIATWLNRSLKWDPTKEEIVGDTLASRWLDRPRRTPWRL